mmetsp:Transcript_29160/g.33361  ORF Transcript_29160/g.33361 Transcript_29160/m.33361 type:complete len:146 (-) Transcript_29160:1415-1852(-)
MISIAKYKCLQVLMQMLVGRRSDSYVYYLFRRVLEPKTFRINFAYQAYFIKEFHQGEYSKDLFFRYDQHIDEDTESPLIIEIGFQLYFLLMRMRENMINDMDEKYYKRLIRFMSRKQRAAAAVTKFILLALIDFFIDVYKLVARM